MPMAATSAILPLNCTSRWSFQSLSIFAKPSPSANLSADMHKSEMGTWLLMPANTSCGNYMGIVD